MKLLLYSLLLTLFASCSQPKESIILKTQFKPQVTYDITFERINKTGQKYPTIYTTKKEEIIEVTTDSSRAIIKSILKTGNLKNKSYSPITLEFQETISNDLKTLIPEGTIIYGKSYISGKVGLDSIVSNQLKEKQKNEILNLMKEYFSELSFTKEKIKIGGDISQKNPSLFPVLVSKIRDTIYTNYRLIKIKNKTGEFNITKNYPILTSKSTKLNGGLKAIITGNGRLFYSASENLITQYILEKHSDVHIIKDKVDTGASITSQETLIITTKIKKA